MIISVIRSNEILSSGIKPYADPQGLIHDGLFHCCSWQLCPTTALHTLVVISNVDAIVPKKNQHRTMVPTPVSLLCNCRYVKYGYSTVNNMQFDNEPYPRHDDWNPKTRQIIHADLQGFDITMEQLRYAATLHQHKPTVFYDCVECWCRRTEWRSNAKFQVPTFWSLRSDSWFCTNSLLVNVTRQSAQARWAVHLVT